MNESIRIELLSRAKHDQTMRLQALKHPFRWDDSIAHSNARYLKQVVEQEGWPTIASFGANASQAAWLIVQHADHDPDFQERCLALMHNLSEGEIDPENMAALEDKIRINKNVPQLYGTQFHGEGEHFAPYPIEDQEHLDERRAALKLEPYATYKARMIQHHLEDIAKKP